MASERKNSSSKNLSTSSRRAARPNSTAGPQHGSGDSSAQGVKHRYAVCVRNDDYPASLELRKIYAVLEDSFATEHGMVRIIDESGEDYLYPDAFFVPIDLPASLERALAKIA
jgi:hypothetical protein